MFSSDVWKNKKIFFLFELIIKFAGIAVFYPAFLLMLRGSMLLTGHRYLTNGNIIRYFTNPLTIIVILAIFFVLAAYFLFEICCISIILEVSLAGKKINIPSVFYGGACKFKEAFKRQNRMLFPLYAFLYPFSNITILGLYFSNFILPEQLEHAFGNRRMFFVVAAFICLGLFAIAISKLFVFPNVIYSGNNYKDASVISKNLMKGKSFKVIRSFVIYNLLVGAIIMTIKAVIALFIIAGVFFLDITNSGIALYLTIMKWVNTSITLLIFLLSSVVSFVVISGMYNAENPIELSDISRKLVENPVNIKRFFSVIAIIGTVIAVAGTASYIFIIYNQNPFETIELLSVPDITAHRGSSISAPENTMAAFNQAKEDFADWIELDVHISLDGEVVVLHDAGLKRTTGYDARVYELPYYFISSLDAGSRFSAEFAGEKVPTLREVLDFAKDNIRLNIEIKSNSREHGLTEKVIELIEEYDMVEECVITSSDLKILNSVKKLNHNIKTGYILSAAYGNYYQINYVDIISINSNYLNKSMVDTLHNNGKEIYAWTVNIPSRIKSLANMGVDNIITDDPVTAREAIYSRYTTRGMVSLLNYVFGQ